MTVCCNSAGGTLRLTIDGIVYSVRGNVTIMPTNLEREAGANLDGSVWVTNKPVPATIEMTVSDRCGLDLETIMGHTCVDATVELDSVGRTYVLVQASVIGRPSLDPTSGEISGLSMVASAVRTLHEDV
jgi:hypothetical protein